MFEKELFQGQVAIVTGAGTGIGFEIAQQLAIHGAAVMLNDRNEALAQEAAQKIKTLGADCTPSVGDVSNVEYLRRLIAFTIEHFGKIDIAIANAGITTYGSFFDYSPQQFEQLIRVNLQGTFFLAQAAAKQMVKQGHGGRLLFTSSVTGHAAHQYLEAYGMTKAGIEMLAKGLIAELSPYQITVNTIAPGATLTERTLSDDDYEATWSKITPIGKPATTKDIAYAALYLVSPYSGHVTGQTLIIDGGWTAMSPSPFSGKESST